MKPDANEAKLLSLVNRLEAANRAADADRRRGRRRPATAIADSEAPTAGHARLYLGAGAVVLCLLFLLLLRQVSL